MVHVVDRDDYEHALSDEAVLYAVPCRSQAGADDPTTRIPSRSAGDRRIRIGMVHGTTLDLAGHQMNFPIASDSTEQKGLNYLAMGDTHGYKEYPPKSAPLVYPGAPEATTFGEENAGYVAIVMFPRHGRPPIVEKQQVARWRWRDEVCTRMDELEALRHQDLKEWVIRLTLDMEVGISECARVDDIIHELQGDEAVCGKAGVLHVDNARLVVNAHDSRDFDDDLPDVLKAVVTRLQQQLDGPNGVVARQAMVLLHKTLRELTGNVGRSIAR